jgi:hypothetical protein
MWRAHQVAMVPLSHATIASKERRRPSSLASTWGFIGDSVRVARLSISSRQSFMRFCAVSRKPRSDLRPSRGRSAASVRALSPTRPTSTG